MNETNSLSDDLQKIALETNWLGRSWHFFPEIGSTNSWLKENGANLPHGAVAITDYQAAGKGRLGRTWVAAPQTSILHSLLLKPDWPAEQANWLTMIAGLAAVDALRQATAVPVQLKWPNDIVILRDDGELRKCGGILLDGQFTADNSRLNQAIVGIGLNINLTAAQLPPATTQPTSIMIEHGRPVSRPPIVAALLANFETQYEKAASGQSPHTAWGERLVTNGQQVTVTYLANREQLTGQAVGTNPHGHLLVQDYAGKIHEISAGDVTLRPSQ